MVCGREIINLTLLRRHTVFGDKVNANAKHVEYFWNVLHTFTQEELKRFVQFTYAQRRLPSTDEEWRTSRTAQLRIKLYRFPEQPKPDPRRERRRLSSRSGQQQAIKKPMSKKQFQQKMDEQLPTAQTCFFDLYLPSYSSEEIMRARLLTAISLESFDNSEEAITITNTTTTATTTATATVDGGSENSVVMSETKEETNTTETKKETAETKGLKKKGRRRKGSKMNV
jgi:hypothetical protein